MRIFIKSIIFSLLMISVAGAVETVDFSKDKALEIKVSSIKETGKRIAVEGKNKRDVFYGTGTKLKQERIKISWYMVKKGGAKFYIKVPLITQAEYTNIRPGQTVKAKGKMELTEIKRTKEKKKTTSAGGSAPLSSGVSSSSGAYNSSSVDDVEIQISTLESSEGCTPRADLSNEIIYIQKKSIKAGEVVSPCGDSGEFYYLQKDYKSCEVITDTGAGKIFEQYLYYYTHNGERVSLGVCYKDDDKYEAIPIKRTVSEVGCSPAINRGNETIYIQKRVFENGEEVEECSESGEFYSLIRNYDACPQIENLTQRKIFSQHHYIYTRNDVEISLPKCYIDLERYEAIPVERVESEEGCTPRINTSNETIYIQKKILEDDVEVEGCQDSGENYTLIRNYDSCGVFVNASGGQVYNQYNYRYSRDDIDITLEKCYKDTSSVMYIEDDFLACEISNNFDDSISTRRSREYYVNNTNEKIYLTECTLNPSHTYTHSQDYNACTAVEIDGAITPYLRKYITIDGVRTYISNCEPETASLTIEEEFCNNDRFAHDFSANLSYYKKSTYFLRNDGEKINLTNCIQSTDSVPHIKNTDSCPVVNSDINKTSNLHYRVSIEDKHNGFTNIEISGCRANNTAQAYSRIGNKWTIGSQRDNSQLIVANLKNGIFLGRKRKKICTRRSVTCIVDDFQADASHHNYNNLCYNSAISNNWRTVVGNHYIDVINSDQWVTYNAGYVASSYYEDLRDEPNYNVWSHNQQDYHLSCINPRCNLTTLYARPYYLRGDESEYIDNSTITSTKYVCGNGNVLEGVVFGAAKISIPRFSY